MCVGRSEEWSMASGSDKALTEPNGQDSVVCCCCGGGGDGGAYSICIASEDRRRRRSTTGAKAGTPSLHCNHSRCSSTGVEASDQLVDLLALPMVIDPDQPPADDH